MPVVRRRLALAAQLSANAHETVTSCSSDTRSQRSAVTYTCAWPRAGSCTSRRSGSAGGKSARRGAHTVVRDAARTECSRDNSSPCDRSAHTECGCGCGEGPGWGFLSVEGKTRRGQQQHTPSRQLATRQFLSNWRTAARIQAHSHTLNAGMHTQQAAVRSRAQAGHSARSALLSSPETGPVTSVVINSVSNTTATNHFCRKFCSRFGLDLAKIRRLCSWARASAGRQKSAMMPGTLQIRAGRPFSSSHFRLLRFRSDDRFSSVAVWHAMVRWHLPSPLCLHTRPSVTKGR